MPFLKYLNAHASAGRYASPAQPITTPSEFPGIVTIGQLSDSLLLNIFRYYLDVSPQNWPRLVHICCRWRHIVFASQQILHLRIFYTHGMPPLKTLRYWPAMPIAVKYGGSPELGPPTSKEENTIMAALKRSGRVGSISLTVTRSLLEKLSSIKGPFSELEDLVLLSQDGVRLTLPSNVRWGPRLHCLHSTRVAIPGLLPLLSSSTNLVDLRLHEVFDSWRFSPEALTDALCGMTQLQSLSLHFPSTTNYQVPPQLYRKRAVLPVLLCLDFRGISGYLERLVAKIAAPRLGDIELTFLDENMILFPNLREFIDRIEMHKLHCQAHILSSENSISISLIRPGAPTRFRLQLFCKTLSEQILFMIQVCIHSSALLFNVEDLRISTTRPPRWDSAYSGWRDLLNSFTGVKRFHWNHPTSVVHALRIPDRPPKVVLPALHKLYLPQPEQYPAPLEEAVVSFIISRQLSGHHIVVEYEQLGHIDEPRRTGPLSQQVTIKMLSDDVLLNIFRCYLDVAPRAWPMLTYVCQRWRQIVHMSPLGLNLRLYFTPGTPVFKALDCWPALPIIIKYGGVPSLDPPVLEDDENVIVALKQSDRVSSISLTVTSSLLDKLSAISEPFSELEEIVLLASGNMQLTLPSAFRWGPHLRTLHSTRVAFPSLPQLLSSSHDLVDIQLHMIPSTGYFSPEAFANALSGTTNLRTLSLHFLSLPPRRNYLSLPPPSGERIVLPALTFLTYRGTSKYLDSLVARIDAPGLRDIDIAFFSQPTMDASELGRFIERTGIPTPFNQAEVQTSDDAISILFSSFGTSAPLRLRISCEQLDWQLSCMAQICDQFSPFLYRVNYPRIHKTQPSNRLDDADDEQWLGLIRAFSGATEILVANELTTSILGALGLVEEGHTTVLPNLHNLYIENRMVAANEPSWKALLSCITLRSRSGHPIQVNVPFSQCQICHASFKENKGLDLHLIDKHGYRIFCSYCKDFECKPPNDLFRKHLKREHPEVWRNDARIGNPWLTTLQLRSLVAQHSFLRVPDAVAPSTTTTTLPIVRDSDTRRDPSSA